MQIRSRDLSKPKNIFLLNGSTFLVFLNFDVSFMISRLLDTLFLHLEKLRYFKRKFLKDKSHSSGDWVLVEEAVYF